MSKQGLGHVATMSVYLCVIAVFARIIRWVVIENVGRRTGGGSRGRRYAWRGRVGWFCEWIWGRWECTWALWECICVLLGWI